MVNRDTLAEAIVTTLLTSGPATLLAALIGVPLGAWCARKSTPAFQTLRTVVTALYGLPPVVVGVVMYAMLSRSGPLGQLDLLFTVEAMVLAQTVLILPLVWGGAWAAFAKVDRDVGDVLQTFGFSPRQRFWQEVRLARYGVYHAVVLAFGRAVAEVGAVIMVGGNIAGKTRVMTTSIVLETSKGNLDEAMALGVMLLLMSLVLVGLASFVRDWRPTAPSPVKGSEPVTYPAFAEKERITINVIKEGTTLLTDVVVDLEPGSIVAVVGESGAGKTTLLRALAGLEGFERSTGPFQTAYLPQHAALLTATVAEEVGLASSSFAEVPASGSYFLKTFDLVHVEHASTSTLSGGERQRAALARQMGLHPTLLLLDEGTSNLGLKHTQIVEQELLRLKHAGGCVVMVTHNMLQAKRLATSIVALHQGRRLPDDDPLVNDIMAHG